MRVQLGIPVFLTLTLIAAPGRTLEKPRLLADIAPGGISDAQLPSLGDFIQVGGRLLFSTPGSRNGDEGILWSTDGTAAGTEMVSSSLCPGECTGIRPLGTMGNVALLVPSVDTGSLRLWRSDGTPEGTYPLTGPLQILLGEGLTPQNVHGFLLFAACDASAGCEIWRSDGTPEGTGIVKDLYPGPFGSYPRHLTAWRGRLYFLGYSDTQSGLWSTDGTPEGTRFIATSLADLDREENLLVATPSRLFFTSYTNRDELWTSDGTPAGTRLVRQFPSRSCPNPHYCDPPFLRFLQPVGDAVYFPASDGTQVELWTSDGTPSGTRRLTDFRGLSDLFPSPPWKIGDRWVFTALAGGTTQRQILWTAGRGFSNPAPLTGCRGGCPDVLSLFPGPLPEASSPRLLFVGVTPTWGAELWVTDGTAGGTRRLTDVCPGPCGAFSPGYVLPVLGSAGGRTYFLTIPTANGSPSELWVSDGTPAGTFHVAGYTRGIGALGGRVYYGAVESSTLELGSTDGRLGGDRTVAVLRREEAGSTPIIATLGDQAVMIAFEGDRQRLWRSDGTPAGTGPLPRPTVSSRQAVFEYAGFFQAGGLLYFNLRRVMPVGLASWDWALWRTDGTPGGTHWLATAPAETHSFLDPLWRRDWNGRLLFVSGQVVGSGSRCSFWTSDGTAAGTREILPLPPTEIRCPTGVEPFGSRFLFLAGAGPGAVPNLFISDGTPAGTRQLTHLENTRYALHTEMVHAGDTVLFRLSSPDNQDIEVWRTDGTPEGTYRIPLDLHDPAGLYVFHGAVYFAARDDPGRPPALYRMGLDGSQPTLLADADPGLSPSYAGGPSFVPLGDRLFFAGSDRDHGRELWVTDGTPAGTQRVRDIQPGPGSSGPRELTAAGGLLYFTADDGEHGRELWVSDGTEAGTRMVDDLNPGGFSSSPSSLAATRSTLFFAAGDGTTGVEPRALPLAPP
jgi:ELWxxDGT repeat protein